MKASKKGSTSNAPSSEVSMIVDNLDYTSNGEISIPPQLPGILKQFTKGAIRTDPANLLVWSRAYFKCMLNGEVPPVKDRLEKDPVFGEGGITLGLIQVLHKQLAPKGQVSFAEVLQKWQGLCLDDNVLRQLFLRTKTDMDRTNMPWSEVVVLLSTLIGKNANDDMEIVCKVLRATAPREEPCMLWDDFREAYQSLAKIMQIDSATIDKVVQYLQPIAAKNGNAIGPKDFQIDDCPLLS